MICLPYLIRRLGLTAMQEIETLLVSFRAFVGKRREGCRKLAYNIIDEAVTRWFQVMLLREFTDLAVNNRG